MPLQGIIPTTKASLGSYQFPTRIKTILLPNPLQWPSVTKQLSRLAVWNFPQPASFASSNLGMPNLAGYQMKPIKELIYALDSQSFLPSKVSTLASHDLLLRCSCPSSRSSSIVPPLNSIWRQFASAIKSTTRNRLEKRMLRTHNL